MSCKQCESRDISQRIQELEESVEQLNREVTGDEENIGIHERINMLWKTIDLYQKEIKHDLDAKFEMVCARLEYRK